MMSQFEPFDISVQAVQDIQQHARDEYPEESCGLIVGGKYIRCENVAKPMEMHDKSLGDDCPCRMCAFEISSAEYLKYSKIDAVIHSHPGGPFFPSERDMQGQMDTAVPWGILVVDVDRVSHVSFWGDQLPIRPLIGRPFVHGIMDCYSLVRDIFRIGKDQLSSLDITTDWPMDPQFIADEPRSDAWWTRPDRNLYTDLFENRGFHKIAESDVQPGDCFLTAIKSEKLNHGGVYLGGGLIIHHLPNRLSRRDPASIWSRTAKMWIRYKAHPDA